MNLALGFYSRCHSYDETTCLGCTDLLQYLKQTHSYTNRTIINLHMCKGGRNINTCKKRASKMVSLLAVSIARITSSAMTAARQNLSRNLQSTLYIDKKKSRLT